MISKLPPLIIFLTFQLESSRQGTPNFGATFYQYLGNPGMAASEMNSSANYMFASDLAHGAHSVQPTEPAEAGLGTHQPAPGPVWLRAELVSLQDVSISGASTNFFLFFLTLSSHCLCWKDQACEGRFHPSQGMCGELNRTTGFGTREGCALSAVADHQSNPTCRLIRLQL